jgi:hypothetical protein
MAKEISWKMKRPHQSGAAFPKVQEKQVSYDE